MKWRLHASPSCVASSSAYLVRSQAAWSGKGEAFSFLSNTTHGSHLTATRPTELTPGESSPVSLVHECWLSFLWNVPPGLDEPIHRSWPGDTASESHTQASGSDLPRALNVLFQQGKTGMKTLLVQAALRLPYQHCHSKQGHLLISLTPGSLKSKGFV